MAISSTDVNRVLRRVLHPALRSVGFTKFRGRCAWRYNSDCVWALQIQAVGNYFSLVTGFPSMSLGGELCIFFPDFPSPDPTRPENRPPCDSDGQFLPKPPDCQIRYPLQVQLDQSADCATTVSPPNHTRDDVWYVRPDGSNVQSVVEDICRSVVQWGVPLLQKPYNSRAEQIVRRGLAKAERD